MKRSTSPSRPLRVRDGVRALHALFRDPDDTAQVFHIISALSGDTVGRVLRRLQKTEGGRRLLSERRSLAQRLLDRERLRELPEGTLGRAYLAFCEQHGITADGLVAASREGGIHDELPSDELFAHEMLRDAHDLWHVVAGYQTDLIGEASVLALTVAQTKNPGIALIVLLAIADSRGKRAFGRRLIAQAFLRGLKTAWLPAVDWASLLGRPLDEVRRDLGLSAPPSYRPVWPHEVYAGKTPERPLRTAA